LETILDKFGHNFRVVNEIWKNIIKNNLYIDNDFKNLVLSIYQSKKVENMQIFLQFVELKFEKIN
jgi:hypothetical protein